MADSGEVVATSGDSTVPYASLRHCKSWESSGGGGGGGGGGIQDRAELWLVCGNRVHQQDAVRLWCRPGQSVVPGVSPENCHRSARHCSWRILFLDTGHCLIRAVVRQGARYASIFHRDACALQAKLDADKTKLRCSATLSAKPTSRPRRPGASASRQWRPGGARAQGQRAHKAGRGNAQRLRALRQGLPGYKVCHVWVPHQHRWVAFGNHRY